jgi:hypothetical protein
MDKKTTGPIRAPPSIANFVKFIANINYPPPMHKDAKTHFKNHTSTPKNFLLS